MMRKLTHEEIVTRQIELAKQPKLPFCVIVNSIRSLHNVGSIFRTADGVGVEKIWLTGFTGYPPQSGIAKTALGAENAVSWEYRHDILPLLGELKQQGYQLVLLEQMEGALLHDKFIPQQPVCLILGNEVEGVADGLIHHCDAAVEISMHGVKNSLNVAVAFGIIAYHWRTVMVK